MVEVVVGELVVLVVDDDVPDGSPVSSTAVVSGVVGPFCWSDVPTTESGPATVELSLSLSTLCNRIVVGASTSAVASAAGPTQEGVVHTRLGREGWGSWTAHF